jgi:RNA polymerase sigma-70 factor (ECF subfamily)
VTDDQILDLYERSLVDVHRAASRLCGGDRAATEELVQDTYLSLVRHSRERPDEIVGVGWLVTTCRNRFLDLYRSERRRQRRETAATAASPSTALNSEPSAGTLGQLAALPPLQRTAILLRYVDDLPVAEVARLLGKSVHATESLLARGRSALRAAITAEESA